MKERINIFLVNYLKKRYNFINTPILIFLLVNILSAADYKWDVSSASGIQAGNGTWGTDNYWTLDGTNLVAWPGAGNSAYFGGSDGTWTITVNGTQNVDSITFYNTGYTLTNGTLNFGTNSARFYTATNVYATVNSVITGSGGLQKYGIGNLTLDAANTYTGTTYIRYGTIYAANNSAFNNTSIVFDGTGGRICLNNGITISNSVTISVANPGTAVGVIHGPSTAGQTATYSGSITINANSTSGGHFHGGNTTGGLTLSGAINAGAGINVFQRGGRVTFSGGGTYYSLWLGEDTVRLGATNGISTSAVVNMGVLGYASTSVFNLNGYSQTLAGVRCTTSNTAIITNTSGTAATLTLNMSNDYTFPGTISGNLALVKQGSGVLTLSGTNNSYSGATTIEGGRIDVMKLANGGSNSSIGASPNTQSYLYINGGILCYIGTGDNTDRLMKFGASGGGIYSSGSGPIVFTNTGDPLRENGTTPTVVFGGTYTGDINKFAPTLLNPVSGGSMTVIKTGPCTWEFTSTSSNTYNYLTVNEGILIISGKVSTNAAVTINNGGTLISTATTAFDPASITVNNGGTLQFGNGGTTGTMGKNVTNNGTVKFNRSDAVTVSSYIISGSGSVVKEGPSSLTFTNNQTFTGDLIISQGSVRLGVNGTTGSVTGNIVNNDTLIFNRSDDYIFSGNISGSGKVIKWGSGKLILTGTNTYTGGTYNVDGTGIQIGNNGTSGSISGNIVNQRQLIFKRSDTYIYSGVISDVGAVSQEGSGTLIFTGNNTYTGTTTISSGTLQIGNNGTSGSISNLSNITNNSALVFCRSDNYTYSGVISGSGSVTNSGSGTLTLSGTNTYTGATIITGGVISVSNLANGGVNSNIGASAATADKLILNGGALVYTGGGQSCNRLFSVGTSGGTIIANGSGALNLTATGSIGYNSQSGSRTLTFGGSNTGDNTFAGVIGDNGGPTSVEKDGSGKWIFTGNHTYTGSTTVSAGTLHLTGSLGSSTVSVVTGATLSGTGSIGGSVNVSGILNPGSGGTGALTINNNLTISSGELRILASGNTPSTQYNKVNVNGGVTLSGAILTFTLNYSPSIGDSFVIIENDGSDAVSGTFSGISEGGTFTASYDGTTYTCQVSYVGGSGNDVVVRIHSILAGEDYSEWKYSQRIYLNTTPTGANVQNNVVKFPVLIRLNPGNFNRFSEIKPAGADIRFAKANGSRLYYCIERWLDYENDQDTAEIWVLVDTVYGNNNTQYFLMYWGKSDAADSSKPSKVFDTSNGFVGVWHLNEPPGGGVGTIRDATSNNNHATSTGGMSSSNLVDGVIGKAHYFDGVDDGDSIPHNSTLNITRAITISAWVKVNTYQYYSRILAKSTDTNADPWTIYTLNFYSTEQRIRGEFSYSLNAGSQKSVNGSTSNLGTTNFFYAVFTYDRQYMRLYINGIQESNPVAATDTIVANDRPVCIGKAGYPTGGNAFKGIIDEVRLEKVARSADWIKLCYENQKINQTLVELEDYNTWSFSRRIMINTAGITTTNCINFPLLVRLNADNFEFNQAMDNGEDIRFSMPSGKKLHYEIESWSKTNKEANIWVRVDTVYGNNSSQYIVMYWGKRGVPSLSDGSRVFDTTNGFMGVWHLGGNLSNSAQNNYHGTNSGSVDTSSGVIGRARAFDGVSQYFHTGDMPDRDSMTFSFWMRLKNDFTSSTTTTQSIWGKYESDSYDATLCLAGTDFKLGGGAGKITTKVEYNNASCYITSNTSSFTGNSWYYVTWKYGGGTSYIYLNGIQDSIKSIASQRIAGSGNDEFGRSYHDDGNITGRGPRYFSGTLDEIRIERVQRSEDWIRLCYENQKPSPTIISYDSADAYRPLNIRRYGNLDSVYIGTTRWAIKFTSNKGGGISFLAKDTLSNNQVDANLFYVVYNNHRSDTGIGTITVLDSSIVFGRVRQEKVLNGQPFRIDYTVTGSGKIYVKVYVLTNSSLSGSLEFRVANNATSNYKNISFGTVPSTCKGVMHVDSGEGKYDLLLVPYERWGDADEIVGTSKYTGLKNSSWNSPSGKIHIWEFMIDFSHILLDSAKAYSYIEDYINPDTLSFYAGTTILEQAWESHIRGHWKFDEGSGSGVFDNSGNGNNGTIMGIPKWTKGKVGFGDSLSGDSIVVPHHITLNGSEVHTVMCWIKPSALLGVNDVILKKFSTSNSGYKFSGGGEGKIRYTISNSGNTAELTSSQVVPSGEWTHVAAQAYLLYNREYLKLFINGKPDTFVMGNFDECFGTNTESFVMGQYNGVIDDVRFYNAELTDEEMRAISQKGYSPEKGMYCVRADNNNTIHCIMHGYDIKRFLPIFQITNYWSSSLPLYVYVDGIGLTQGIDYFAALDDNRNQLTIGFNRNISTNSVIFIDDNSLDAYYKTGPTKKMYWGIHSNGESQYFWVKNTSGSYFGSPTSAQFYINWKMNTSNSKDGEIWQMRSSVTNPYTFIDTSTGYNLIPIPGEYYDSWGSYNIVISGQYLRTTVVVTNSFSYAVEESSAVRVRLRINERVVSWGGQSYKIVTKWTIYPTGQFFRYDSIYQMSGAPSAIYIGNFFKDQTYSSFVTNEAKKRGAVIFSQTYPDFVVAWLSMKNASGYQSEPFDRDTITTRSSSLRVGIDFEQSSTAPSKWNSSSVEAVYYLDIQHPSMSSASMDSISNGVQCIKFPNRRALSMITGTLDSTSVGDLNGDGFNETEGAYIVGASNNTVHFVLPAKGDTCRYYPAFRIKNYLSTSKPQYVFVYNSADTVPLLEGYQFNSYVKQSTNELIIQIDSIFCDSVGIYISSDKTLAVKMSKFEVRPGNRSDTILWRTESEYENMGFWIMRRINPQFLDSVRREIGVDSFVEDKGSRVALLLKHRLINEEDTNWVLVNSEIIRGSERGVSEGPRDYRYIDRGLYNGILYDYRLIAVDYREKKEEYGPVSAMPYFVIPKEFRVWQNYPNPFRYSTNIRFSLPVEGEVLISIYNIKGRLVRRLMRGDKKLPADIHVIKWDGRNERGEGVSPGPYICRVMCGTYIKSIIMLKVR